MGADAASDGGRRYGGASAGERRAARRQRLIRAAIGLYAERGFRRTTVGNVCRAAALTPRYFYEAFDGSEALLLAAFDEVATFVEAHVAQAAALARGSPDERLCVLLTAYYDLLREEPATARVFLSEVAGIDDRVDALFARSLTAFAELIARTLSPESAGAAIDPLVAAGAMHGLLAIAREWVAYGCREPVAEVISAARPLCRMLVATEQRVAGEPRACDW